MDITGTQDGEDVGLIALLLNANAEEETVKERDKAKLLEFDNKKIKEWIIGNGIEEFNNLPDEVKTAWTTKVENENNPYAKILLKGILEGKEAQDALQDSQEKLESDLNSSSSIPTSPSTGEIGTSDPEAEHTMDDIIQGAKDFLLAGTQEDSKIDTSILKKVSDTIYNVLLSIAIIGLVVIGMLLGVKYIISSTSGKVEVKESLMPYVGGCILVFCTFTIWKLAVTLLGGLA